MVGGGSGVGGGGGGSDDGSGSITPPISFSILRPRCSAVAETERIPMVGGGRGVGGGGGGSDDGSGSITPPISAHTGIIVKFQNQMPQLKLKNHLLIKAFARVFGLKTAADVPSPRDSRHAHSSSLCSIHDNFELPATHLVYVEFPSQFLPPCCFFLVSLFSFSERFVWKKGDSDEFGWIILIVRLVELTKALFIRSIKFVSIDSSQNLLTKICLTVAIVSDILAIVIDKLEQRIINTRYGTSTIQEFVIINHEKIPLILTFWNDIIYTEGSTIINAYDKMPIIEATRLIVSDYHGVSLSAKGFANVIVNPSYPETQSLRAWRAKNHSFLNELVSKKEYLKRPVRQSQIPHDNFSSIANVITNNTDDKFWIKAKARIMDVNQTFWYMACNNCFKATTGQYEWTITCNFCHTETIVKPRTKFTIIFADELTQLDVMIFGELAENLLGLTAVEIMTLQEENKAINIDAINERLSEKQFIVQIKKRMIETHYGMEYRYTVSSLDEIEQTSGETLIGETSGSLLGTNTDNNAETSTKVQHQSFDKDSQHNAPTSTDEPPS